MENKKHKAVNEALKLVGYKMEFLLTENYVDGAWFIVTPKGKPSKHFTPANSKTELYELTFENMVDKKIIEVIIK